MPSPPLVGRGYSLRQVTGDKQIGPQCHATPCMGPLAALITRPARVSSNPREGHRHRLVCASTVHIPCEIAVAVVLLAAVQSACVINRRATAATPLLDIGVQLLPLFAELLPRAVTYRRPPARGRGSPQPQIPAGHCCAIWSGGGEFCRSGSPLNMAVHWRVRRATPADNGAVQLRAWSGWRWRQRGRNRGIDHQDKITGGGDIPARHCAL